MFGRNWLRDIQLDWKHIATVSCKSESEIGILLEKYSDVFLEDLGTIRPFTAKLVVREGVKPKFCHTRLVPFALRHAVEAELDRLEQVGVLEKTTATEWVAPVVIGMGMCNFAATTISHSIAQSRMDVDQSLASF